MAWRGGVTSPSIRNSKKFPHHDPKKSPKNKKRPLHMVGKAAKVYLCQFKPLGRNGLRVSGKGSKGFFLTFSTNVFFSMKSFAYFTFATFAKEKKDRIINGLRWQR